MNFKPKDENGSAAETDMTNKKKRKLSKQSIIAICIVCVLVIAFAVAVPLYLNANRDNRELYSKQLIEFSVSGQETVYTFNIEQLIQLVGSKDFNAVYKPSGKEAITKAYIGIEVKKVFEALEFDITNKTSVRFSSSDGQQKVYTIADVKKDNEVFIAFKVNGKNFNNGIIPNAYSLPEEDGGPYVVIKASDTVSQNRAKLLTKITVA